MGVGLPVGQGGQGLGGACAGRQSFLVGSGIYDITGPAAEVGMMGYVRVDQQTEGIHQRLRSRAFVIASPCNGKRVVFVSADLGMVFQGVKQQVVERLRATFGSLYSDDNVVLSATHTHSGPGGYSHYALYNLSTFGFEPKNFEAIVNGIYQSIVRAHEHLGPGHITLAAGDLLDASRNRSAVAYQLNPPEERERYAYDTDKRMTLLRFTKDSGVEVGLINWFAVHATSMGKDYRYISGDNKGYASYLFEKAKGTRYDATGDTFVAAFAQANEGDVTPNIFGGEDGGGKDDFESTEISGRKQYERAASLYSSATTPLTGGVDYRHVYVKMDDVEVRPGFADGTARHTCPAAIGISMLAGAEDGPGVGVEGATCAAIHDVWSAFTCTTTTTPCQAEKPIVLSMGSMKPFPWSPEVLPLQLVTVGNVALVAVPFELTTMAGRRLRETVRELLAPAGVTEVVIAGLSNAYSGYVTTREEYARQEYEGASTHFGPWTLAALQQEFDMLARALREGTSLPPGPTPRDLCHQQSQLRPGVLFDDKPLWADFGDVFRDARASYARGETVRVTFWGGHPKNDLHIQGTYLRVQRRSGLLWEDVAYDWDWETKYTWRRAWCLPTLACSHVTVEWTIPQDARPGTYRILHEGDWKSGWDGRVRPYQGTSRTFTVR
ncbi:neutral/alkaline non-lysosomal ceramidase N-terminal domain-containing protein [Vitiosangium sp. GDMCC 1.1324]|uniref:neutral/alkaline ceramidase n=1 Tax=Vitiosangium sp. (strain GDMCC 1.1324) TaxID=2138576 RepID=UPI000D3D4AD1|nr:neutral/alkaline non-lysosomal ceramidase N-terminal domain-containing protein [Vitiosangium sp. GDMCC 1.1324]PTL80075.1 alkaline ceramidase [Vitiosangium sp. GDMCC 1.1324]